MKNTIIRYVGNKPNLSNMYVGDDQVTNEQFQPWQYHAFEEAAQGLELRFPFEDVIVTPESVPQPFIEYSDKIYGLQTGMFLTTPDQNNLLVVPHSRYYLEPEVPLPLTLSIQTDWYVTMLNVLFVKPTGGRTVFYKDKPYAQLMVVPRTNYQIVQMTQEELNEKKEVEKYIADNHNKYTTRTWKDKSGMTHDNLYNVLCCLEELDSLPEGIKPKKKKIYEMGKNKKKTG